MGDGEQDRKRLLDDFEADLRDDAIEPIDITVETDDDGSGTLTVYYRVPLPGQGELLDVEVERALRLVDNYLTMVRTQHAEDLAWSPVSLHAGAVDPDRGKTLTWSLPVEAARAFIRNEVTVVDLIDRLGESATLREDVEVVDGEVSFARADGNAGPSDAD